ncbi:response regulator [candidate division KSB1 bacterium]|nr:response regulator [candidate division KSB1 bacterium]
MVVIPKNILVVDDEEDITWGVARNLMKDNTHFKVTCANTGTAALEHLKETTFDLVLSDIRMPGINGLDLLLEIRKKYPETKVIIMTAYGTPETKERVNLPGSIKYIEKPFEMEKLKKLIFEILTEPADAFEEHLTNIMLADVIHMYCLSQNTVALTVSNGVEKGVVYFRNGEIVHAQCRDLIGEAALFCMLKWKKGNFKTTLGDYTLPRTIKRGWQALLSGWTENSTTHSVH